MKYDDEVKLAIAMKLTIRVRKRIKQLTAEDDKCRERLSVTMTSILHFCRDVFEYRPEVYAAILILADATREMMTEYDKTKNQKVIYL